MEEAEFVNYTAASHLGGDPDYLVSLSGAVMSSIVIYSLGGIQQILQLAQTLNRTKDSNFKFSF